MHLNKTIKMANACNCISYSLFQQRVYLECFNARDPDPSLRKGYWQKDSLRQEHSTSVVSHGPRGVCLALTLVYIKMKANYQAWKNFIYEPEGAAEVRGITNFSLLFTEMKNYDDHRLKEICRPLGLNLYDAVKMNKSEFKTQTGQHDPDAMIREIVYLCVHGRTEFLSIRMSRGAHAVAIRTNENSYKIFDPNLGEFIFKTERDLIEFLKQIIAEFYTDIRKWGLYHMIPMYQ